MEAPEKKYEAINIPPLSELISCSGVINIHTHRYKCLFVSVVNNDQTSVVLCKWRYCNMKCVIREYYLDHR